MGHLCSIRVHMTIICPRRHALTFSITCSLQHKLPGECNHAAGRANPLMTQSLNWLQSDPNQSLPVRPLLCKLINRGTASGKVWPRSEQWVPWETITQHFVTNYRFFRSTFISFPGREGNRREEMQEKKYCRTKVCFFLSHFFFFFSHFFVSPEMQLAWCKIVQCFFFWINKPYFSTLKPDYAPFWHEQMSLIMFVTKKIFSRRLSSLRSTFQENLSALFPSQFPWMF